MKKRKDQTAIKPSFTRRMSEEALFFLSTMKPKSNILRRFRTQNLHQTYQSMGPVKVPQEVAVDRVKNITEEEFIKEYFNKNKPVIFDQQAKDWPCCQKWNLEFLRENFGDQEISNLQSKGLNEKDRGDIDSDEPQETARIKINDLVDGIYDGTGEYIRFSPFLEQQGALLQDLDLPWLKKMRRCFFGVGIQSFIGAKGRRTPLHNASMAFMYIMAEGTKTWTLIPPSQSILLEPAPAGRVYNFPKNDLSDNPYFDRILKYKCEIKQGDILFVPAWMWHEVYNETHSWGVSYRYTSIRSFMSHLSFALTRVFLSRPSFFGVLFNNFLSRKKSTIITPKIFFD